MDRNCLFSSGVEVANLLISSGLLSHSWEAILDTHRQFHPLHPTLLSVKYKVHPNTPIGTIITFISSPEAAVHHLQTEEGRDLVSSEELERLNFNVFDFVGTKVNPSFSIHKTAVSVFHSLLNELTLLRNQFGNASPLIITGHCLGGSIASLFTLWLFENIKPTTSKRPLCITFGSPLLGDKYFQQAILERPTWNSSFVHVVSNKDLVPHLFISQSNTSRFGGSISQNCPYKPFGTFLLCSESGCSCFEETESILDLLWAIGSNFVESSINIDYGVILNHLMHKSICKEASMLVDNSMSNLQAGIMTQLTAIGVETQGNEGGLNSIAANTIERDRILLTRKKNMFDPHKKLTNRKIDMTYLEWYMKISKDEGGYYDSYKNKHSGSREQSISKEQIRKCRKSLTNYWKKMVEEVKTIPQEEGASFRMRWLYGGTNYRRMVEPLDIADYYKKGQKDYVTRGRSEHYVLLEKWFDEDSERPAKNVEERKRACGMTEDSCFWAYVEEAIICCKVLMSKSEGDVERSKDYLVRFEGYVMDKIKKFAVSPEIFLPQSSFMEWWKEYSSLNVWISSCNLDLVRFMRNDYRNYA